ncbi:serine/threonine protein kinase [Nitzschia inconspicua]|uniref:Serine/threonine protein kinase n=1 Tax=Nitzschia inconspicua TaxID=303405 RepID=A0A9K3LUA7_9STRA|nr:serine/threonine protein kinase [Nitzschia inconspicua]
MAENSSSNDHTRSSSGAVAMLAPSQAIRTTSAGNKQQQPPPPPSAQKKRGTNHQQVSSASTGNQANPPSTQNRNRRRAKKKNEGDGQSSPTLQEKTKGTVAEPQSGGPHQQQRRNRRGKKGNNNNNPTSSPPNAESGTTADHKKNNNNDKNQKKRPPNKRKPKKKYPWRRFLPKGSVDPITLENLQTLEYPPFALCADEPYVPVSVWPVPEETDETENNKNQKVQSVPDLEELNRKRLAEQWGSKVLSHSDGEGDKKPAATDTKASSKAAPPPSKRPYNLFDGRALAYYMVSQLQFIDPLNRRDLTRPELVNLDDYLQKHGLYTGELKVTEAYDAKGITLSSAGAAANTAQGRANIMQQMAQQLLNALFTGHSVAEDRNQGSRGRRQESSQRQQAQSYSLHEQYAAMQLQEQVLAQQLHSAPAANSFGEPYLGDSGVFGSIDVNGGGGFMIVDDDENPELRGEVMTASVGQHTDRREHDEFPSLAGATNECRHSLFPGATYSASHIAQRYGDELRRPDIPFPALPVRPGSRTTEAAPAPASIDVKKGPSNPKKGPSKTLSKISGLVKKTDPEEKQRQWEAREAARKRALLSNLSYGVNPSLTNAADSLLQPPTLIDNDAASEEKLERNRAFAEALGVKPATQRQQISGWSRPTEVNNTLEEFKDELSAAVYPQELIALARERIPLLLKLEKKWKSFLEDDKTASLSLYPMDKPGRKLVHHYAEFWSLKTESFDPEPKRYSYPTRMSDSNHVDDLRQKGNHEFQQGNLDNATAFYTAAIELASKDAHNLKGALIVNLCNRSASYFQMEEYEKAKEDAERAWKISQESNVKSAYRLAKTLIALKEFQAAIDILQVASKIDGLQEKEVQALQQLEKEAKAKEVEPEQPVETSIKQVDRPISIREFTKGKSLGVGNFSEIIIVTHKVTKEQFALKILEKKAAADLAKRQHPNVYNEIAMEARVLMERLPPHPNVITMYHSFSDYNNLYYLMDLHNVNPDLWTQLRYKENMVGAHVSQVKRWMMQLIDALEHLHSHGICHRDLKPENVLLNAHNHVVIIDFGTAKDLIKQDLNGPEFVGTPDFMSPEAVTGFSGMPGQGKPPKEKGATSSTDLWALGAMAYILHTGTTPFWSPSPYLGFLRIKRGILTRTWGIPDDDTWNLIESLMKVKPEDRLGADCFEVENGLVKVAKGYDVLRSHSYFEKVDRDDKSDILPTDQDLCIRACADQVVSDAMDLDICEQHPPGDGSKHDMTRLSQTQQNLILHVLDKSKVFSNGDKTRVFQRFFQSDVDYIKAKVRPLSRDFVGLTPMNDDEYKPMSGRGSQDPYATKIEPEPTKIVMLTNPILMGDENVSPEDEKRYLKGWKNCIATINKKRPKAVVICAKAIPPKFWKFLARIRDSIQVLWNDGSVFYSFWLHGFQGIVLNSSDLKDENCLQMRWIREQMEQSRMAKPQLFCFCNCDPADLPTLVIKRLARGRTLSLMGLSNSGQPLDYKVKYTPNETVDDNTSVKSNDSDEDEDDTSTMRVFGNSMNGLRWLTVDEKEDWYSEFEAIDMPEA